MKTELQKALDEVSQRFRSERLWAGLALCWLIWAVVGACLWSIGGHSRMSLLTDGRLLTLLGTMVATGIACAVAAVRSVTDVRWVARRVEARFPELATGLMAAIEEVAATPSQRLGFLQATVIRKALNHHHGNNWNETVPAWRLRGSQLAHALSLGLLIAVVVALAGQARSRADFGAAGLSISRVSDVQIDPGDTEVERGTPLLVVARFQGAVPPDAHLIVAVEAQKATELAMTRSLDDPTFAGHVEAVDANLSYRVEFQRKRTKTFHVRVFEYPELLRAGAKLVFPRYTSLEPKAVEDIRHVTAVEGTELTLLCQLNKDVSTAQLVDAGGQALALQSMNDGTHRYRAHLTLSDPRRFRIRLVDHEGRTNKLATEIVANVTRNRPPVVKITQPARDVAVSALEELRLKAELEDDFGLVRYGLTYSMAGREPREVGLPVAATKVRQARPEHLLDFESLQAAPDQLLTYFFWAEDIGPDGQQRRTSSDMFFAEVRPFEEIFRQGEQPPSGSTENEEQHGQQGNAQASDRLAELQKEIINGTWKLIRRETGIKPTEKLVEDATVLKDSQKSAIEQAGQLAERLQDAASKASLEQATRLMKDAEKRLNDVVHKPAVPPLSVALTAEQWAYQALLKLRAREIEVIRRNARQQRQGGRNASGNRSQRQLQQLELTDEENRYEDQRSARARQESLSQREREQRETGQVLNRLRELAQRQNDVNDRLKELQSALEAAKAKPAREEIERQLKRLREQQQQILRDTDELRERMEREENQDRMADARQQVDESREHVRQVGEALESGRIPRALTEGARAGRQFNDVRDELRKGAANHFSQDVTEMREQARRLDENQKKLSEQLEASEEHAQTSLRDTGERKKVADGLQQQQQSLDKLLDQMRNTVQSAEETEPLLAKNLYDTVRKANEQKIPDALKAAGQLTELGVSEDAAKASRHAGRGIEQMREGVERSAKSVLGDDTAALRRAQAELEDLADQVNQEVAQATGQPPSSPPPPRQGKNAGKASNPRSERGPDPENDGKPATDPADSDKLAEGRPDDQNSNGPQGQRQAQTDDNERERGPRREAQPGNGQQERRQRLREDQARQEGGRGGSLRGGGADRQTRADSSFQGGPGGPGRPITGDGFLEWSDRMRDVEELLDNPEMRAETARIRARARAAREEFKRHAKVPDWNQMKGLVAEPINELRDRIAEEIRRRTSPDALVPIDRDPVPPQFAEDVRRYYERLGSGR